MIGMFDKDKTGSINFEEFSHLWRYVTDWLNCFRSFDRDNSGNIDPSELRQALTTFGYRFTDSFLQILMKRYDREGKGKHLSIKKIDHHSLIIDFKNAFLLFSFSFISFSQMFCFFIESTHEMNSGNDN